MKFLDRFFALLLNVCVLVVALAVPAFTMMSSKAYYHAQFEKNGIYATVDEHGVERRTVIRFLGGTEDKKATFSDEQLDQMIDHIVDYLFTDQESFVLVMDGVKVNGTLTDDVNIFGETAVKHMKDVKELLRLCIAITIVAAFLLIPLIVYFVGRHRKGQGGILLKYTFIFYASFVVFVIGFCIWTYIKMLIDGFDSSHYMRLLWRNIHYFLFPDPEKFANAFMNDTLTEILTLDLFMTAVYIILLTVVCVLAGWMTVAGISDKRVKRIQQRLKKKRN